MFDHFGHPVVRRLGAEIVTQGATINKTFMNIDRPSSTIRNHHKPFRYHKPNMNQKHPKTDFISIFLSID